MISRTLKAVRPLAWWLFKHAAFIVVIHAALLFLQVPAGLAWWQVLGGGACLGLCNVIYARWLQ